MSFDPNDINPIFILVAALTGNRFSMFYRFSNLFLFDLLRGKWLNYFQSLHCSCQNFYEPLTSV
jgi:hypothetical protein